MTWKLITDLALALGFIIALFEAYFLYREYKRKNKWQKINATMEYLKTYPNLVEFTINCPELKLFEKDIPSISIQDLTSKLNEDPEFKAALMSFAGYFEYLALGIKNGYFDEYTAQEYLHLLTLRAHEGLTDYFKIREEQTGRPVCNNFKKLYNSWKDTKYLTNGKKFEITQKC